MSIKDRLKSLSSGNNDEEGKEMSKDFQEIMAAALKTTLQRLNDMKESLGRLEAAMANLREEVRTLHEETETKNTSLNKINNLLRPLLEKEIFDFYKKLELLNKERAYKKFFTGELGFLYLLSDILASYSNLKLPENHNRKNLEKFYGKHFNPIANNLIILKESISSPVPQKDLTNLSMDELTQLHNSLLKDTYNKSSDDLFYTNLWEKGGNIIEVLCDVDLPSEEKGDLEESFSFLGDNIHKLANTLSENGIEMIGTPRGGNQELFKEAASEDILSKPAIIRSKDKLIYTYGILNPQKPFSL